MQNKKINKKFDDVQWWIVSQTFRVIMGTNVAPTLLTFI